MTRRISIAVLILLGGLSWMTHSFARQVKLDHALIQAIKSEDNPRILEALAQGANGEARDTGKEPTVRESLLQLLDRFRLRHTAHIEQDEHLPALVLLFSNSYLKMLYRSEGRSWPGPSLVVVRALLDHGARVEDGDMTNETPLHFAREFSNSDMILLLLKRGANINARDYGGSTPLINANAGATEVLVDHGANIEAVNDSNQTALMLAARNGDVETVRILLEYGAKVGVKDQWGGTALYFATTCMQSTPEGKRKMVDLLRKYASKRP